MDGNALEVALGLMRVPSMRGALRQRPLPEGVGELIELAADVPGRMAEASALCGETPQQILEAARFYVREVLLFPGADAYRVLGVSETASAAQIKLHYRRLQHWLHPDRRGDDWESVFAIRINTAWGELRTPARRAIHDARRAQSADVGIDTAPHRVLVNDWRAVPEGDGARREWLLPATAIAGCLALAVLVALKGQAPAPEWDVGPDTQADADADAEPPSLSAAAHAAVERLRARLDAPVEEQPAVQPAPSAIAEMAIAASPPEQDTVESSDVLPVATPVEPAPRATRASASKERSVRQEKDAAARSPESPERTIASIATPAREVSTQAPVPLLEQVQLAHRRGLEITKYLGSTNSQAPPIWNSPAALDNAAVIRERLDGGRSRLLRKVRFGEPDWRIAEGRASMTAKIERSGRGAEDGVLRVDLVWREDTWMVQQVAAVGL